MKVCVAEVDGDRRAAHEDDHADRDDHGDDAALSAQPGDHGLTAGHWEVWRVIGFAPVRRSVMFGSPMAIPITFTWSG